MKNMLLVLALVPGVASAAEASGNTNGRTSPENLDGKSWVLINHDRPLRDSGVSSTTRPRGDSSNAAQSSVRNLTEEERERLNAGFANLWRSITTGPVAQRPPTPTEGTSSVHVNPAQEWGLVGTDTDGDHNITTTDFVPGGCEAAPTKPTFVDKALANGGTLLATTITSAPVQATAAAASSAVQAVAGAVTSAANATTEAAQAAYNHGLGHGFAALGLSLATSIRPIPNSSTSTQPALSNRSRSATPTPSAAEEVD